MTHFEKPTIYKKVETLSSDSAVLSHCPHCQQKDKRIEELEDALRFNQPATEIYVGASEEIERLRKQIAILRLGLQFIANHEQGLKQATASEALAEADKIGEEK